jgi:hypothetical protein
MAVTPNGGAQANGTSASKLPPKFEIVPPDDTPEYMWPAYFGALHWALGAKDVVEAFTIETGIAISLPRSGLDAMIDQATGFDPAESFLRAFVPWFNAHVWGPMNG